MGESEVARLRRQIELEYEATQRVFVGFTPTARHRYVNKRQENIEGHYEDLKRYVPPQEAIQVIMQAEEAVLSRKSTEKKPLYYFAVYLEEHALQPLDVSIRAKVRYMTVYHAIKGIPITSENARKIRQAVFEMTGIAFEGEFVLTEPEQS